MGHLVLGLLTFLIPWFLEVYMTAVLVLGVKLGSRSICNGIIIIPRYTATYHLIQKSLSETSIPTLYRAFHNLLLDYKNLLQENPRTRIYKTCTDRRSNSKFFSLQVVFLS